MADSFWNLRSLPQPSAYAHRLAYADAFRAFAIAGVVFTHIFPEISVHGHIIALSYLGILCVNVFFVLSGYLLSLPFIEAIINQKEFPKIGLFFKKRLFRIYPAYFIALLISMIGVSYDHKGIIPFFFSHLTFVHGFMPAEIISRNAALWTMALDVQFYVVLPFLSLAIYTLARKIPRSWRSRALFGFFLSTISISFLWRCVMMEKLPAFSNDEPIVSIYTILLRNLIGVGSSFAIGSLVALGEIERVRFDLKGKRLLLFAAFLLLLIDLPILTLYGPSPINGYIEDLLAAVISGIFFLVLSFGDSNAINIFVRSRLIRISAELSYSVYLIHWMCLWWVRDALAPKVHLSTLTERALLTVLLTLLIAWPLNRWVERPFLRAKKRLGAMPVPVIFSDDMPAPVTAKQTR